MLLNKYNYNRNTHPYFHPFMPFPSIFKSPIFVTPSLTTLYQFQPSKKTVQNRSKSKKIDPKTKKNVQNRSKSTQLFLAGLWGSAHSLSLSTPEEVPLFIHPPPTPAVAIIDNTAHGAVQQEVVALQLIDKRPAGKGVQRNPAVKDRRDLIEAPGVFAVLPIILLNRETHLHQSHHRFVICLRFWHTGKACKKKSCQRPNPWQLVYFSIYLVEQRFRFVKGQLYGIN
jgi:hypothetical protein